ncbi:chromate transporter [Marinicrinis lubricantis]|uniref:Chromate transporter n=1 Tax=Marinicrinis lubricantis TaxID=2086470 RepID=A0ABW1INQ4_9BACL
MAVEQVKQVGKLRRLLEVIIVSTKLGLTSFGGPVAHLGYFQHEYIQKRKWLDERSYADLVALCQFLPGPASSQVGIGIGLMRAGILGGICSFIGFTLPSVLALVLFALFMQGFEVSSSGWLHGLKIVAVAIVAQAIWNMGQKLAPDKIRMTIAIAAASAALLWASALSQIVIILASACAGILLYRRPIEPRQQHIPVPVRRSAAVFCFVLFFLLLFLLPILREASGNDWVAFFDSFYRSGSLVFGGGHVVLPLLESELVTPGWMSSSDFLAGYGAAQAVPGPLFTFAAYAGAVMDGWMGAMVATAAIFLPAFLLVIGVMPFWDRLRSIRMVQAALTGVNAAVVGILLAALYDPIWTSTISSSKDFVLAMILFIMLIAWKCPPWVVVLAGAAFGAWFL